MEECRTKEKEIFLKSAGDAGKIKDTFIQSHKDKEHLESVLGVSEDEWFETLTAHQVQAWKISSDIKLRCARIESPVTTPTLSQLIPHLQVESSPCSSPAIYFGNEGSGNDLQSLATPPLASWEWPSLGHSPGPFPIAHNVSTPLPGSTCVHSLGLDDSHLSWTNSLATPPRDGSEIELVGSSEMDSASSRTKDTARALFSPGSRLDTSECSIVPLDSTFEENQSSLDGSQSNKSESSLLHLSRDGMQTSTGPSGTQDEKSFSQEVQSKVDVLKQSPMEVKQTENGKLNFRKRLISKKNNLSESLKKSESKNDSNTLKFYDKNVAKKIKLELDDNSPRGSCEDIALRSHSDPDECSLSPTFSQKNSRSKSKSREAALDSRPERSSIDYVLSDFFDPPSASVGKRKPAPFRKNISLDENESFRDMTEISCNSIDSTPSISKPRGALQSILASDKKTRGSSCKNVKFSEKVEKRLFIPVRESFEKSVHIKMKKKRSQLKKVRSEDSVLQNDSCEDISRRERTVIGEESVCEIQEERKTRTAKGDNVPDIENKTGSEVRYDAKTDIRLKFYESIYSATRNGIDDFPNKVVELTLPTSKKEKNDNEKLNKPGKAKEENLEEDLFSQVSPSALNQMCDFAEKLVNNPVRESNIAKTSGGNREDNALPVKKLKRENDMSSPAGPKSSDIGRKKFKDANTMEHEKSVESLTKKQCSVVSGFHSTAVTKNQISAVSGFQSPVVIKFKCSKGSGFQTATGRPIPISHQHLEKAKTFLLSDDDSDVKVNCDETAKNEAVNSIEALSVKKVCEELRVQDNVEIHFSSSIDSNKKDEKLKLKETDANIPFDHSEQAFTNQGTEFVGFQTASGKSVTLNDEKLKEAEKFWIDANTEKASSQNVLGDIEMFNKILTENQSVKQQSSKDNIRGKHERLVYPGSEPKTENSSLDRPRVVDTSFTDIICMSSRNYAEADTSNSTEPKCSNENKAVVDTTTDVSNADLEGLSQMFDDDMDFSQMKSTEMECLDLDDNDIDKFEILENETLEHSKNVEKQDKANLEFVLKSDLKEKMERTADGEIEQKTVRSDEIIDKKSRFNKKDDSGFSIECSTGNKDFVGFSTASGRTVSISKMAMKSAAELFSESEKENTTKDVQLALSGDVDAKRLEVNESDILKSISKLDNGDKIGNKVVKSADEKLFNMNHNDYKKETNSTRSRSLNQSSKHLLDMKRNDLSLSYKAEFGPTCLFQTASGKSVNIKPETLKVAKQKFNSEEFEMSENDFKEETNSAASCSLNQTSNQSLDVKSVESSVSNKDKFGPTCLFQTASGTSVTVQPEALKAAKQTLIGEEFDMSDNDFSEEMSSLVSFPQNESSNQSSDMKRRICSVSNKDKIGPTCLFQTASGKAVTVQPEALKAAKQTFNDEEFEMSGNDLNEVTNSKQSSDMKGSVSSVHFKDKFGPTCLFQTASGKSVTVQPEALKAAKQTFNDEEFEMSGNDFSEEMNSLVSFPQNETSNQSSDMKRSVCSVSNKDKIGPTCLFQTASGKAVTVQPEALKAAKQTFTGEEFEMSDNDFKEVTNSLVSFPQNEISNQSSDMKGSVSSVSNKDKIGPTCLFQTASGKSVNIKPEALKAAKQTFNDEDFEMSDNDFNEVSNSTGSCPLNPTSNQSSDMNGTVSSMSYRDKTGPTCLFQTASGKSVTVQPEALKAAKQTFTGMSDNDLTEVSNSTESFQQNQTSKQSLDVSYRDKIGPTCLFQTASGKSVTVQPEALKAAKQTLIGEDFEMSDNDLKEVTNSKQSSDIKGSVSSFTGEVFEMSDNDFNEVSNSAGSCPLNPTSNQSSDMNGTVSSVSYRDKTGPTCLFQTASGKSVTVQPEALKAAKQTFTGEEFKMSDNDFNEVSNSTGSFRQNQTSKQSLDVSYKDKTGPTCLFQTASGKPVTVQPEALKAAKQTFTDEEFEMSDNDFNEVSNSAGSFQQNQTSKQSLNVSCKDKFGPTCLFQTAGGKSVTVQPEALKAAKQTLIGEDFEMSDNDFSEEMSSLVSFPQNQTSKQSFDVSYKFGQACLFQTASGKSVTVQPEALKAARQTFDGGEFEMSDSDFKEVSNSAGSFQQNQTSKQSLDVSSKDKTGPTCLFQTASGKSVTVQPEALKAAKQTFNDEFDMSDNDFKEVTNSLVSHPLDQTSNQSSDTKDGVSSVSYKDKFGPKSLFQTASGKSVTVQPEALRAARQTFDGGEFEMSDSDFKEVSNSAGSFQQNQTSKQSLDVSSKDKTGPTCLFQTASGKSVTVQPEALKAAKQTFNDEFDMSENGFKEETRSTGSFPQNQNSRDDNVEMKRELIVTDTECLNVSEEIKYSSEDHIVPECSNIDIPDGNNVMVHVYEGDVNVTSESAKNQKFTLQSYCGKNTTCVMVGDGTVLIPDDAGQIGKQEFYRAFLTIKEVDAKLVSESWLFNHYRWIVWKLFTQEKISTCVKCLTPERVMLQLKHRYEREIILAQRSSLKKIYERDDTPSKRLVLCVAAVKRNSVGAGDDQSKPVQKIQLELTDGWYSIPALIDGPLTDLVEKGRICVGRKLCITGADLVGGEDACTPLEALPSIMLRICRNSCRPASLDSILGYQKDPRPLCVPLSSLVGDGGLVGMLDVVIVRKYPIMYMEKIEGRGATFRTSRCEDRASLEFQTRKQLEMEKLYRQLETTMEKEVRLEKRKIGHKKFSEGDIENLQTGQDIYEAMEEAAEPDMIQVYLRDDQQRMLYEYQRQIQEQKQSELNTKFQRAWQQKLETFPERSVRPVLKFRVAGCATRDIDLKASTVLTVWGPSPEISELQEGQRCKIYSLNSAVSRSKSPGCSVDLTATRQTRFRQMQLAENILDRIYEPREVLLANELKKLQPPYGELDFVGVIIKITTDRMNDTVYLADYHAGILAVCFQNGCKSFGEDLFTVGQTLCCSNLMDKSRYRYHNIPTVEGLQSYTHITSKSQNAAQRKALDKLNTVAKDKTAFIEKAIAVFEGLSSDNRNQSIPKKILEINEAFIAEFPRRKVTGQVTSSGLPDNVHGLGQDKENEQNRKSSCQSKRVAISDTSSHSSVCTSVKETTNSEFDKTHISDNKSPPSGSDVITTPVTERKRSVAQSKMAKLATYGSPSMLSPLVSTVPRSVSRGFKPPAFKKL